MAYVICEQQRRRSACTSAQSDQRLCCSLLRLHNISRFYSRNFKTLGSFCGCAGRFVSGLVGNSRRYVLSCRGSYITSWNSFYVYFVDTCEVNDVRSMMCVANDEIALGCRKSVSNYRFICILAWCFNHKSHSGYFLRQRKSCMLPLGKPRRCLIRNWFSLQLFSKLFQFTS